jgi:hypothetical protein
VATYRERLRFRFFRVVEGEAEGRLAIAALVVLVLAVENLANADLYLRIVVA